MGLSGGADSVCLTHVLSELRQVLDLRLVAAHVNHRLRADADDDEAFSKSFAQNLNLPFLSVCVDVAALAESSGRSLEDAARRARYEALGALAARHDCDRIAVGHTLDDQAETVFMRLCRGSGTRGLAGIYPKRPLAGGSSLIRPLLSTRRSAVLQYLSGHGLSFREDSTNADRRFTRNRVRHDILPHLRKALNPRLTEALAATAELRREEEDFLDQLARKTFEERLQTELGSVSLAVSALASDHPALARRLVRLAVAEVKGETTDLSKTHVDEVLSLLAPGRSGRELHLPGLGVVRSFDALVFRSRQRSLGGAPASAPENGYNRFEYRFAIPSRIPVRECRGWLSANLEACAVSDDGYGRASGDAVRVAVERSRKELKIRNPEPSDRFRPLGAKGSKRLSRYLMERRVASEMRQHVPVVVRADSDEILWVVGHGVSELARIETGERALHLQWQRGE